VAGVAGVLAASVRRRSLRSLTISDQAGNARRSRTHDSPIPARAGSPTATARISQGTRRGDAPRARVRRSSRVRRAQTRLGTRKFVALIPERADSRRSSRWRSTRDPGAPIVRRARDPGPRRRRDESFGASARSRGRRARAPWPAGLRHVHDVAPLYLLAGQPPGRRRLNHHEAGSQ
jgi:hypothetical protein